MNGCLIIALFTGTGRPATCIGERGSLFFSRRAVQRAPVIRRPPGGLSRIGTNWHITIDFEQDTRGCVVVGQLPRSNTRRSIRSRSFRRSGSPTFRAVVVMQGHPHSSPDSSRRPARICARIARSAVASVASRKSRRASGTVVRCWPSGRSTIVRLHRREPIASGPRWLETLSMLTSGGGSFDARTSATSRYRCGDPACACRLPPFARNRPYEHVRRRRPRGQQEHSQSSHRTSYRVRSLTHALAAIRSKCERGLPSSIPLTHPSPSPLHVPLLRSVSDIDDQSRRFFEL